MQIFTQYYSLSVMLCCLHVDAVVDCQLRDAVSLSAICSVVRRT